MTIIEERIALLDEITERIHKLRATVPRALDQVADLKQEQTFTGDLVVVGAGINRMHKQAQSALQESQSKSTTRS